mgnify:CR=1 FL=1
MLKFKKKKTGKGKFFEIAMKKGGKKMKPSRKTNYFNFAAIIYYVRFFVFDAIVDFFFKKVDFSICSQCDKDVNL